MSRFPGTWTRFSLLAAMVFMVLTWIDAMGEEPDPGRFAAEIGRLIRRSEMTAVSKPTLFVGSSSFRLWTNLAETFPKERVVNHGFGGSHLSDVNHFFEEIVARQKPARVLVYAGDNDLAAGKTPERIRDDFVEFLRKVRSQLGNVPVAFVAIKPSPKRESQLPLQRRANELVRELCNASTGAEFLDIATPMLNSEGRPRPELFVEDQLHMNEGGYKIWTPIISSWFSHHPSSPR